MSDPIGLIGIACLAVGAACLVPCVYRGVSQSAEDVFNRDYDRLINTLIDGNMIVRDSAHTAIAGNLRIWVANYPHSFGHPYGCGIGEHLQISADTKRRLHDHMQRLDTLLAVQKARGTA